MHYTLFKSIWVAFVSLAERVLKRGGCIAIEWPANCAYWRWECVVDFVDSHNLRTVRFDGCALGIKSRDGNPILKPWKVATNMLSLVKTLEKFRCDGSHEHVTCRGVDAKLSENYSPKMVAVVHDAFALHVRDQANRNTRRAVCCIM
jgi:hypothetical protein